MDKKSLFFGMLFMAVALGLMYYNSVQEGEFREAQQALAEEQARQEAEALAAQEAAREQLAPGEALPPPPALVSNDPLATPVETPAGLATPVETPLPPVMGLTDTAASGGEETPIILESQALRVEFTPLGGAISKIILKDYPALNPHRVENPPAMTLNQIADVAALSLNRASGFEFTQFSPIYELVSQTDRAVVFATTLPSGLILERVYEVSDTFEEGSAEPYIISHTTRFRNETETALSLDTIYLNAGTGAPTDADRMGFNLNVSYHDDGDYKSISSGKFRGGFFSSPQSRVDRDGMIEWAAVKNQFFVQIMTPLQPAQSLVGQSVDVPPDPRTGREVIGVSAMVGFEVPTITPGGTEEISVTFFAGPKDYDILQQLPQNQKQVMQLGWFMGLFLGFISGVAGMLMWLLNTIYGFIGNWGFAIILMTVVIRLLLWPLTAKAARANKRMQKLQGPLAEIREKHKDNPQKLNQEMMGLWKKHKVNPLAGCWPVLLQFPVFISMFNLLRNSSDLRYADWLWITDLSMPDATIPLGDVSFPFIGNAINILPFFWLVSMWFQMKMMPPPAAGADNPAYGLIKFMPFIFFPFTYFFSSGLVLYWTTTNAFSIFQQWRTNQIRDDEDVKIEHEIEEAEEAKERKSRLPSGPLVSKKKKKSDDRQYDGLGSTRGKKKR